MDQYNPSGWVCSDMGRFEGRTQKASDGVQEQHFGWIFLSLELCESGGAQVRWRDGRDRTGARVVALDGDRY